MSPSYHEVRGVCVQARPGAAVTLTLYADGTRIATVTDTQAPLDDGNIGLFVNGDVNFGQVDCILSGARSTNDSTAPRRFGHPRS